MIMRKRAINVLLVEDNPGDIKLTQTAFKQANMNCQIHVAHDGVEALDFLHRRQGFSDAPRPDLILLDLNLPRMGGREFLEEVKSDAGLLMIPVIVMSTSDDEQDILEAYRLQASWYITKPEDFGQYVSVVKSLHDLWLTAIQFPPGGRKLIHSRPDNLSDYISEVYSNI